MPHSVSRVLVHVVFGIKNYERFIRLEIRGRLNGYFLGILKNMKCQPVAINCVADHAHLLFVLAIDKSLSEVVKKLKGSSSAWLKSEFPGMEEFRWQVGYGAFSVSYSDLAVVTKYIRDQERHHSDKSFPDEFDKNGNLVF